MVLSFFKRNWATIFVFLISLLPLLSLLNTGLPITHDGLDHAARISSFYKSLSEGNIIPRWASNLNWGYGHPVFMFLYPLPSYATSFFHLLGLSYVDSLKIVFAISYSLSGLFMFAWLRKFLNSYASITGAILYLFAPYRFIDLYVRGALGEHVAFIFMPLVLLALLNLNRLKKGSRFRNYFLNFIFIAFSFSFLILSHNAISLLFIPFIFFYTIYLFFENKSRKKLIVSFASLLYGSLISFFFWFPAFSEGKYTLRDIVTQNVFSDRFINLGDLIYGNWNYGGTGQFTVQLGFIQIILFLVAITFIFISIRNKDYKKHLLLISTVIFLFLSIFLMVKESSFIWEKITTLQKLQFPWRLLSITTFCSALIGAIMIDKIKIDYGRYLFILIIIFAIIPTIGNWNPKEYKFFPNSYFEKAYPSTTDTGESSPIWSVRSMDEFPNNRIELLEGNANIREIYRSTTRHEYLIDNKERIRVKENTIYFPGWKIYDNEKPLNNIEFQDPVNRGVITFYLEPGSHNIILKFENTKLRNISEIISLISIFVIIFFPIIFLFSPQRIIRKIK